MSNSLKRSRPEDQEVDSQGAPKRQRMSRENAKTVQRLITKGNLNALSTKAFALLTSIDKAQQMLSLSSFNSEAGVEAVSDLIEGATDALVFESKGVCNDLKKLDPDVERLRCLPGSSALSIRLVKE